MRQNPHVRICGGPGSATTLVYPTPRWSHPAHRPRRRRRPYRRRCPRSRERARHPPCRVDGCPWSHRRLWSPSVSGPGSRQRRQHRDAASSSHGARDHRALLPPIPPRPRQARPTTTPRLRNHLPDDPVVLVHQEHAAIGSRAEAQVDADRELAALLARLLGDDLQERPSVATIA